MILARHAEALFWAGRLLERAEHTTRVLDVVTRDSMHFRVASGQPEWPLIIQMLGLNDAFAATGRSPDSRVVASFLFVDGDNPGSVVSSVYQLRENIRMVRDRVPVELWEEANRLHLTLQELDGRLPAEPFESYMIVRRRCHAMGGVVAETMARGDGFTFLVAGRMIERAMLTCRVVRFLVLRDDHALDDGSILRAVSSLQAYRRRVGIDGDRVAMAEFLLRADDVPRTVLSCLRRTDGRLQRMRLRSPGLEPALMVCGRLRAGLEFGDIDDRLMAEGTGYVVGIEWELNNLATAISEYAFDPARIPAMQAQFVRPGDPGGPGVDFRSGGRFGPQ